MSVAARKWEDLAWIEAAGYTAEHTGELEGWLCGYDLIVNTVPARVLDEGALRDLKPGCLIIDLASKPGGVDFEAARTLGVRAIWALSNRYTYRPRRSPPARPSRAASITS